MSVTTDYPDWSPHVATAQQIAGTGVPLLTGKRVIYNTALAPVPAATFITLGLQAVTQPSYEINIRSLTTAPATVPFLQVMLEWFESGTGQGVGRDVFMVPCATGFGGWVTYGRGPAKGDQVNVQVNNLDGSVAASVAVLMLQVSRVYTVDQWGFDNVLDAPLTVPANTLPGLPNDPSSLGQLSNTVVAASASAFWLFGMHNGPVGFGLWASVGSLSTLEFGVGVPQMDGYAGNAYLYRQLGPPSNVLLNCPRTPLLVLLHNTATTSMTMNVTATAAP